MQNDIIANPRRYWQFINSKTKSDNYPASLKLFDCTFNDPKIISDLFATYFKQAFIDTNLEPDEDYFGYMNNSA